ncbi:unnamed protein product [Malus baccata var. baccata]
MDSSLGVKFNFSTNTVVLTNFHVMKVSMVSNHIVYMCGIMALNLKRGQNAPLIFINLSLLRLFTSSLSIIPANLFLVMEEKCGVCLLHGEDAVKFKFDVV